MHSAIDNLNVIPELLLVDGDKFKPYYNNNDIIEHVCVVGGDSKYIPIACASILAKVYHDQYVENLVKQNPDLNKYDWCSNMCYGTKKHIDAINKYGLTEYHRKTFGICNNYI